MPDEKLIDVADLPERLRGPLGGERGGDDSFLSLEELQCRHILRVLDGVGGNKARGSRSTGNWPRDHFSDGAENENRRIGKGNCVASDVTSIF